MHIDLIHASDSSAQASDFPQVWAILMRFLTARQPHIKQYHNQSGACWWQIYDPATGQTAYCSDEHDIRLWLDKRY